MSQRFQLDVGAQSDTGLVREINEDSWGTFETTARALDISLEVAERKGRLYAVADGMGGHAAGEVASKRAINVLFQHYYEDPDVDLMRSLERAFWAANAEIYAQAATNAAQSGMGTTLVAAVVQGDQLIIANVGDSRAYLIREGQAQQISRDHSWVNEQVEAGLLTEVEAQTHIYRNIITRSLGSRPDVTVDTFAQSLQVGDVIILCTDGISNELQLGELTQAVSQMHLASEAAATLIRIANQRGGTDNLTTIVIRVTSAEKTEGGPPLLITGIIGGMVLVGAFILCMTAGILPATLIPKMFLLQLTTPYPTPVISLPGPINRTPSGPGPGSDAKTTPHLVTALTPSPQANALEPFVLSLPTATPLVTRAPLAASTLPRARATLPVFGWEIVPPNDR